MRPGTALGADQGPRPPTAPQGAPQRLPDPDLGAGLQLERARLRPAWLALWSCGQARWTGLRTGVGAGSQTRTWSLDPCSSGAGLQGGGAAFTPGSGPLREAQGQSSGLGCGHAAPWGAGGFPQLCVGMGWGGPGPVRGQWDRSALLGTWRPHGVLVPECVLSVPREGCGTCTQGLPGGWGGRV